MSIVCDRIVQRVKAVGLSKNSLDHYVGFLSWTFVVTVQTYITQGLLAFWVDVMFYDGRH